MEEHREKSAVSRSSNDRRDVHRRSEHRRKGNNVIVDTDKRKTLIKEKAISVKLTDVVVRSESINIKKRQLTAFF